MNKNNLKFSKKLLYLITAGGLATLILSKVNVTMQYDDKDIYMANEKNDQEEIKNRKLKLWASENTSSFCFSNYHITENIINLNDISPNTEKISFFECKIDNLEFISSLQNLNNVVFSNCKINNLSSISELDNLKKVSFIDCEIDEEQFKNLNNSIEHITIDECSTEQFKNICAMTNLKFIILGINNEFDYTLFSKLNSDLEGLFIADSCDTDVYCDFSNISNLKSLKTLSLRTSKKVKNIDLIKNLTSLNTLVISEDSFENLEFVKHIPNLENLYLTVSSHDLENGHVDISPIIEINNERQEDNKLSFQATVFDETTSPTICSLDELQELISNKGKQLKKSKN